MDYLLAPMPFVIGVHSSHAEAVQRFADSMNEVVFVNIDTAYCNYFEEDLKLLPPDITVRLRYAPARPFALLARMRKGPLRGSRASAGCPQNDGAQIHLQRLVRPQRPTRP